MPPTLLAVLAATAALSRPDPPSAAEGPVTECPCRDCDISDRRAGVVRALRPGPSDRAGRGELARTGVPAGRWRAPVHGAGRRRVPVRRRRPPLRGPGLLLGAADPGPRPPGSR